MKALLAITTACAAFIGVPGFAAERPQAVSWSGLYLGGFIGAAGGGATNANEPIRLDDGSFWYRPFHSPYSYSLDPSVMGGITVGYNLQVPATSFVVGIEGEYGYFGAYGRGRDINQLYYGALQNNFVSNVSLHRTSIGNNYGYGLIGGRIGYAVDRLLLYVKGGAVFTSINTSFLAFKDENNIVPLPRMSAQSSVGKTGYAIGGGLEYALATPFLQNVSLKVEYLYLGVENTQSSFGYCSCGFHWVTTDSVSGIHTGKIGLNYRFSEFSF